MNSVDSRVVQNIRKKNTDISRMSQNHFYTLQPCFKKYWNINYIVVVWRLLLSVVPIRITSDKIIMCNICSIYINAPSFFYTAIIVLREASAPPFSREQIYSHYLKAKTVHLTSHCASRSADKQCYIVAKPYIITRACSTQELYLTFVCDLHSSTVIPFRFSSYVVADSHDELMVEPCS